MTTNNGFTNQCRAIARDLADGQSIEQIARARKLSPEKLSAVLSHPTFRSAIQAQHLAISDRTDFAALKLRNTALAVLAAIATDETIAPQTRALAARDLLAESARTLARVATHATGGDLVGALGLLTAEGILPVGAVETLQAGLRRTVSDVSGVIVGFPDGGESEEFLGGDSDG